MSAKRKSTYKQRKAWYDKQWEKTRNYFIQRNPTCAECERRGFLEPATQIDHIIPVEVRPDLRLDQSNLQPLCAKHHNVWKRRLEQFAIQTDQTHKLPEWCKNPDTRPPGFKIAVSGPLVRIK